MATVIVKGLQIFCNIPGSTVLAPIFMTLFVCNPLNISILLTLVLSLYYTTNRISIPDPSNPKKSFANVAKWTFIIYAMIALPLWFLISLGACRVSDAILPVQ